MQSYDPRSPTQEFERTPIIISSKIDDLGNNKKLLQSHDENFGSPCLKNDEIYENCDSCAEAQESPDLMVPKNLCNGFYDMTLNDTIKETEEPLGSSTASNEAIEENIDSESTGTKFLETNFEFVEMDYENHVDDESNDDSYQTEDNIKQIPLFKILNEDPRSPSTGIERTPIVVAKITEDTSDGNVEEMSDDTLIKVLQSTKADLCQTQDQDNSDELLIYEDESNILNVTPKKSKSDGSSDSRTPLSCMKNKADMGHIRSKSANTVQDHKGQKVVPPKRVSHIPRLKSLNKPMKLNSVVSSVSLKNLSKTSAVSGDCENTPPHSHRDRWDKDNSIVL